ncbi:hypothetical protein [Actinoalloteichus spitiensis]|uniref:hypothetical protein n=1 Tax=Actinoalloteichus spitiensis TaxID=252394 RepID=UPI0012F65986|nr:hypothetical protein [Actinoalloteichus spitiensis]
MMNVVLWGSLLLALSMAVWLLSPAVNTKTPARRTAPAASYTIDLAAGLRSDTRPAPRREVNAASSWHPAPRPFVPWETTPIWPTVDQDAWAL